MKPSKFLLSIIFFISSVSYAQTLPQDTLIQYYQKYPQQALKAAREMYEEATRTHNNILLIKSVILNTTFSLKIDRDRYPQLLQELEKDITQEKDLAAKAILNSYAGQLYSEYYNAHRFTIDKRPLIQDTIPANISEWTAPIFKTKILEHLQASVSSSALLQEIPVDRYRPILLVGNASDSLRPTLYDFLIHRAIGILENNDYIPEGKDLPNFLTDAASFVNIPLPSQTLNITIHIMRLWQDLLRFRIHAGEADAFLMADLERLDYAKQISGLKNKDSLYLQNLRQLQKKYEGNPFVVEVMAKEAACLLTNNLTYAQNLTVPERRDLKKSKQEALRICEEGIRLYPHYSRINLLYKIKNEILTPVITTQIPHIIYPGDKLDIKITSSNLSKIEVTIYQINTSSEQYFNLKNKKNAAIPKKQVFKRRFSLSPDIILQDTTLSLPLPQSGLYQVILQSGLVKQAISNEVICTQLFCTARTYRNQHVFRVRDWKSGKPIPEAKVLLYKQTYPTYTLQDSVYTDQQGFASLKKISRGSSLYYQVVNSKNPNGNLFRVYDSYSPEKVAHSMTIITDREIYRPGQTVYFQGIYWDATPDTLYTIGGKKTDIIFRDANYKEIAKQQVITNTFGSFSGKFVIPQQTLNGNFSITSNTGQTNIIVADYKRPELEITFFDKSKVYYTGDTVQINGKIQSFSGVALADNPVQYEISYYSPLARLVNSSSSLQGIVHTHPNGEFQIRFKAEPDDPEPSRFGPYFYQVKVKVTDSKGETQEGMTRGPLYNHIVAPVIELECQVNKEKPTPFYITLEGQPAQSSSREVSYTISSLVPPASPTLFGELQDTIVRQVVSEGKLLISNKDSIVPSLSTQPSGLYLFTVQQGTRTSKQIFYLYSPKDKRPPVPTYEWIVTENTRCRPGETAHIQFGTSVKDAYVTYEIYTPDRRIKRQFLKLNDEIIHIDVPYRAEYGNTIWLYINYVKDKHLIEKIIPITRLREDRILDIQTIVFRDKLQPGEQEKWTLKIRTKQDFPAKAEVLAMMYDASLDQLAFHNIDFHPNYLYAPFPYSWEAPYAFTTTSQNRLVGRNATFRNGRVPEFIFDRLNTFHSYWEGKYEVAETGVITVGFSNNGKLFMRGMAADQASKAKVQQDFTVATPRIQYRENFQETAFFYPQLLTDSLGNIHIDFTVPETLTKWKFYLLAYTKDLAYGKFERYITTSKPLMVRPNLPRFFRNGDNTELKVTVSNLSDSLQTGTARIEFFLPGNKKVIYHQEKPFQIAANQSQTLTFVASIPENIDLLGCRISAHNAHFSDGEQHLLAVLPNETLITETQPIYSTKAGNHFFKLSNDSPTRRDYRLTLELTSNPIWYAVLALPALTEPAQENVTDISSAYYVNTIASAIVRTNPQIATTIRNWSANKNDPTLLSQLERNSELKSILLAASPWVLQAQNETERMQTLASLFDQNRLSYLQNQALEKLLKLQNPDGGWGWFKGMSSSRLMTDNVLLMMARATTTGQQQYGEKEKTMQIKALGYLDNEMIRDFKNTPKRITYDQILYLYTRSMYRDIPLGKALDAHKYFLALAQKQWSSFSLYEKGILAVTLFNYGLLPEARSILTSLRQYSVTSPDYGMYWPNNRNTFYRNSAVQIHTAIMEAFYLIEGNKAELRLMQQWLLRQKQVQSWASVPATVDAIYALLLTGDEQLEQNDRVTVKIGKYELTTSSSANPLGYIKSTYTASEIQPDMLEAELIKTKDIPSWGGLYLQYFEKLDKVKKQKTDLSIEKNLFIERQNDKGNQVLVPLDGNHPVKIGDKVIIRLTLSLKQDMEFLHVKDLRAACFEPVEQLSGNQWKFGTVYYQDTKDAVTNFFFNSLLKGTYVLEYAVWINQAGEYQDGIATFQSIYAPEYNAFSNAVKITVKD